MLHRLLCFVLVASANSSSNHSKLLRRTDPHKVKAAPPDLPFSRHAFSAVSATGVAKAVKEECRYGVWHDWSSCQSSCGAGTALRIRTLELGAEPTEKAALNCKDGTLETRICNIAACPVDCAWSDWATTRAFECSVTCGKGKSYRERTITRPAQYGGQPCSGGAESTIPCNLASCPANTSCAWAEWSEWAGCSVSCGGGNELRTRSAASKECHGQQDSQSRDCGLNTCPADCQLSEWSSWSASVCSVTCGNGTQSRSRTELAPPSYGGEPCEDLTESQPCELQSCSQECSWSEWTEWSACPVSCGNARGTSTRSRTLQSGTLDYCGSASESRTCENVGCPEDCKLSKWSQWGVCSTTCGSGYVERTRTVKPARLGGVTCNSGDLNFERTSCQSNACPVDCAWSDWADWGSCSSTCGDGKSIRSREVTTEAENGGRPCASLKHHETRVCNVLDCPIDCKLTEWSPWSSCDKSCGKGSQKRARSVAQHAAWGGKPCAHFDGTQDCQIAECPVDCKWSEWGEWSSCSSSCGEGSQQRGRTETSATSNGAKCIGKPADVRSCRQPNDCPVQCRWGQWTEWSRCSSTCGPGVFKRIRNQLHVEGSACSGFEKDERPCLSDDPCPVDCQLEDWSTWSPCSTTCGNGTMSRNRPVLHDSQNGGAGCKGNISETSSCSKADCPVDCEFSDWSTWSPCTKSCGGGFTSRSRSELASARAGGRTCGGSNNEEAVCQAVVCPVDCMWSEWTSWSNCSKSCGSGHRQQSREIIQHAQNAGVDCEGSAQRAESCSEQPCPVDCQWTAWTTWSTCTQTCGGGTSLRERQKALLESAGGLPCIGDKSEQTTCKTQGCPRDCLWGPWSSWSQCSETCGGGSLRRYRDVAVTEKNGGSFCLGSNEQEAECNANPCPADCDWESWSEWTACSVSCGGSTRVHTRQKRQDAANGGVVCTGKASQEEPCNTDPCPVDCIVQDWSEWSECSASCGEGRKSRTRMQQLERDGGKACSQSLSMITTCDNDPNTFGCPKTTTTQTTSWTSDDDDDTSAADVLGTASRKVESTAGNAWDPGSNKGEKTSSNNDLWGVHAEKSAEKSAEKGKSQHHDINAHVQPCTTATTTPEHVTANTANAKALAAGKAAGEAAASEAQKAGKTSAEIAKIAREAAQKAAHKVFEEATKKAEAAEAVPETKPCTKERLAATIFGTAESGNITQVVERLMRLKGLTIPGQIRPKNAEDKVGSKVAMVSGSLKLNVSQPDRFVSSAEAKTAVMRALAGIAGISTDYMNVEISLLTNFQPTAKTANIKARYEISVYENDNAGDSRAITQHILPSSSDKVSREIMNELQDEGIDDLSVQALSLSMKVTPLYDQ